MKSLLWSIGAAVLVTGVAAQAQQPQAHSVTNSAKVRIALIGDSTQTKNAGYGLGFCANLTGVVCIDDAKGGASTKTYYNEGYWAKALADKPDYMLIQFGHNDEASPRQLPRETNLQTEYPANLKRYVEKARAHGVVPVLVTPLTRRYYGADGKIRTPDLAW
jgi:lysophospholipase L1-like esterase